jgi:hypothetical protein
MQQNNPHTYELWFMQSRLQADYGSFSCDICGRNFYHSPSIIYYNHAVKHNCCCGYCTNQIIYKEWGEKPYE